MHLTGGTTWWIKGTVLAQMDSGCGAKPQERKKIEAQPHSVFSIRENQKNRLDGFKVSRRLLSSPKCETIRPGAVKGPITDPERDHKDNLNN